MLHKLNDDCLLHIIQYLELGDQVALSQVSSRLNANVSYAWQHKTKHWLDRQMLDHFEAQPEALRDFLDSISGTVKELELKYATLKQLRSWKTHSFGQLRVLSCTLDDEEDGTQDTQLLVELFPGLHSLKLESNSCGQDIWRWTQLRQLDLSCCTSLDPRNVERIFGELKLHKLSFLIGYEELYMSPSLAIAKCSTLAELEIDDCYLTNDFLRQLLRLPRFRKLRFQTRGYPDRILVTIADLRAQHVQLASFNDSIYTCSVETLQQFKTLRTLIIDQDDIEAQDLKTVVSSLPLLEQLHLTNMMVWHSAEELWDTVASCRSLQVLNISRTMLYEEFLEHNNPYMDKALSTRSQPLILHCHNSGDELLIREHFHHPKLKISFEPLDIEPVYDSFIEINLIPLEE